MAKHSYQDMEVTLESLKEKVDFLMDTLKLQKMEQSPLYPHTPRVVTSSMGEIYRELKANPNLRLAHVTESNENGGSQSDS